MAKKLPNAKDIRKRLDWVFSGIDAFVDTLRKYVEVRYKLEKRSVQFQKDADRALAAAKKDAARELRSFKQGLLWTVVEASLLVTAVFAVFAGVILLLNQLLPGGLALPVVLLLYGLGVVFVVTSRNK